MINGPPKVVPLTVDLHEHLIQVPLPVRVTTHRLGSLLTDFRSELWPEPLPPKPNGFSGLAASACVLQWDVEQPRAFDQFVSRKKLFWTTPQTSTKQKGAAFQ